jgi:hypothetical protein
MSLKHDWTGSVMHPEITNRQRGWLVDTDHGTYCVPGNVAPVPHYLTAASSIECDECGFDLFLSMVSDFIGSGFVGSIQVVEGYFSRTYMPGYLDCTDWNFHDTPEEAEDALWDMYGPGD